jgi:hypothetical protein
MNVYQISKVIQEARVLDINTQVIYPLGETAAAIRGENELWLAMVIRNKVLLDLKPSQLAAVCGSLVSDGIKLRPWKNSRSKLQQHLFIILTTCYWLFLVKPSVMSCLSLYSGPYSLLVRPKFVKNALAYDINQLDHQSHMLF